MTAPASQLTFEQAAAAAMAIHAAGIASPDPATAVANLAEQIIASRDDCAAWAKTAIRGLWASVNPYDAKQVKLFAEQAAALMASAQTAAGRVAAAAQAQQLAAAGIIVDAAPSLPIDVRAPAAVVKKGLLVLQQHAASVDYAGAAAAAKVSKSAMSTRGIFERPAKVFRYAKSTGASDFDAAQLAGERIDSLVDDNLMLAQRLAQQQVLVQAVVDLDTGRTRSGVKIIGYRRVIHPELSRGGTCGMCIVAADRIYHVAQLLPIHANCKCTIAAVTEDYDPADDLNAVDLGQLYKDAGGTSAAHLKRTRYKVDEHGELGPVLVPETKYKPRTTKSKVRVGGTALLSDQPAQADVARHQIAVLEENLAKMRSDGIPDDSPKIAYHDKLIAKLRKQVEADTAGGTGGGGGGGKPPTKPPTPSAGGSDGGDEPPRRGSVDRSKVTTGLKQHEIDGAQRLADRGHRVVFQPTSSTAKTADFTVDGRLWELKTITGSSNDAIARNIRRAAHQAPRVILDLTDSPISDETAKELIRHYAQRYNMEAVRLIRGSDGTDWIYSAER